MSPSVCHFRAFQVLCVVLFVAHHAVAENTHYKTPVLEPCKFTADFSTTENKLRSLILKGATEEAAKVLSSNETFSLGAGLMYEDEQTCFLTQSADRTRDPDIVALQALAINAQQSGDAQKLASATVQSFTRKCQCIFTPQELDEMAGAFKEMYEDPEELRFIIAFTGEEEEEPYPEPTEPAHTEPTEPAYDSTGKRRLLVTESSPVDSFVCAHCSPRRSCRRTHWCD